MNEVEPGLWYRRSAHPDAEEDPKPGSPANWPPQVGSVSYVADDALVPIDPLVRYLKGTIDGTRLRVLLQPLRDLSIERVPTSHGEPVLARAHEALRRALA